MSAIFISYTGRDPEGDAWADRLAEWFREWDYGYFRDQDHSHGVKAGDDWRQTLYRELGLARALVCVCSRQFEGSPWCVGEVAIAVEKGKTVIPIQLAETEEELQSQPLPLLLQGHQAIKVAGAANPSPERLAEVKQRLRQTLQGKLNWRDLQSWDGSLPPYPGLPAFAERQAPVFFGRDAAIEAVVERLSSLALRAPAFLLLLGASGYGKSSLVRAGVVPRLRADRQRGWQVLAPFSPGGDPFAGLQAALAAALEGSRPGETQAGALAPAAADWGNDGPDLLRALQRLRGQRKAPALLLVIDQFEELLSANPTDGGQLGEGERFLAFLRDLLSVPTAGLLVLAMMRTDFLAPLQSRWPALTALASPLTLEPIAPADFGKLITGPADRSQLTLQPGLTERLVAESGGGDALPLLAFTLEKLWKARTKRGGAAVGPRGEPWDLTVADYEALGGVAGAVSTRAAECWNPQTSPVEEREALRQAFLDHLVALSDDGRAAKRSARLGDLPLASQAIIRRLVDDRLLVSDAGVVEIAHEALLRTWEPLVGWIEESKVELLQRLRVKRLAEDLKAEADQPRNQALEQLAAAAGGSDGRAVRKEASDALIGLLNEKDRPLADRQDAALVLALIGAEQPLRECLADTTAPVALRRRAAESLGLLAKRCGTADPQAIEQRQRIAEELEGWLRSDALDLRIEKVNDPTPVAQAREVARQTVAEQVAQAKASGQLKGVREDQFIEMIRQAEEQQAEQELWASGASPGWAEHDARLPLLQGAARGLQLAASADLPLLGSGPGRVVPMLTLEALEEGGLRIRTAVEEVPVWRLPLPAGEQLELVLVPAGEYGIGSPEDEDGRDLYTQFRQRCEGVDVEARRMVRVEAFALPRHPLSQGQWRAVVETTALERRGALKPAPGTFRPEGAWERHGQPGGLPVDSVSWTDCRQWLQALNGWLEAQWPAWAERHPALGAAALRLALPSESQWEAACRAGLASPFHFGATLDSSWARYDASTTYGKGRRGDYEQRPVPIGAFGLVNRWGLAEVHGQLQEWCADQWHRSPVPESSVGGQRRFGGKSSNTVQLDGSALEGPDPGLAGVPSEKEMKLLRGGSWFVEPLFCRAAFRVSHLPADVISRFGVRPCCPFPPCSLLGS